LSVFFIATHFCEVFLYHDTCGQAVSIHFATQSETMVMSAKGKTAGTSQLLMAGTGDDALKAWYLEASDTSKTKVQAGQLNLVAYDKQVIEVCLVGVNNASVPNAINIENELNRIYAPAVVQWKVTNAPKLEMKLDGEFDNLHADKMMDYSASEKQVRDAYIKQEGEHFDKSKFYLFLVENKTKDPSIDGYMPFNRQFGFIYCAGFDISKIDKEIRTMAHELGHGCFRLRHTFSTDNQFVQEKGTTDNLMDYADSSPTVLRKYQWDGVRKFHFGINWFEDGSEAANRNCLAPKPVEAGKEEGESKVTFYQEKGSISHGEYLSTGCSTLWKYFMGNSIIGKKADWYDENEYNEIQKKIVKFKGVYPLFIHGTFSDPFTFNSDFVKDVVSALNLDSKFNTIPLIPMWSGENENKSRIEAADQIVNYINSEKYISELYSLGIESKHLYIIAHSHGGNIAKMVCNKLTNLGWDVEVINIATPQRKEYQFIPSNKKLLRLNFYSTADLIQWYGIDDNYIFRYDDNTGMTGARKDPNATNIQIFSKSDLGFVKVELENSNLFKTIQEWAVMSGGHSLHSNGFMSMQISYWINFFSENKQIINLDLSKP